MKLAALLLASWLPLPAATYVFENVNVLPMDRNRILEGHTVLIEDNRIKAVGKAGSIKAPDGAVRIDGRGKFLIPGLTEMHGHLPPPQASAQDVDDTLFLYLANGVTLVRGMLGYPTSIQIRNEIASGKRIGPTLIVAGPALSGQSATDSETAVRMVREQKEAGFDHVKIQEGLKLPVYDAVAKTAKELKLPFAGHIPGDVGVWHAIEAGQATIDHLDDYAEAIEQKEENIGKLAAALKKANVYSVPTMALWETFWGDEPVDRMKAWPELKYMSKQTVNAWVSNVEKRRAAAKPEEGKRVVTLRLKMLKGLQDAGAPIVLGTDSPQLFSVPGFSIHREIAVMARAGMTPYQILHSGTAKVAEYYKSKEFGTVAPGRRADLILLDANPLQDLTALQRRQGVMVRGQWFAEAEIQKRLSAMAARHGN